MVVNVVMPKHVSLVFVFVQLVFTVTIINVMGAVTFVQMEKVVVY